MCGISFVVIEIAHRHYVPQLTGGIGYMCYHLDNQPPLLYEDREM